MAMTQTEIDQAFAAMGLAPPSSALLASLEAIPDTYTALATIIQLPQVQTSVIPIVTMFDLALGHDPVSATLSSMVQSNLSQAQLASDFVSSQAFANIYNGGVIMNPNTVITSANDSIITALFVNGLGHAPTQATLNGFHGLTLATAFLDFSQSQAAGVSPIVDASLTQILELATGIPAHTNPPTPQEITLINGQDSVISGQNTVGTTAPGTLVQSTGDVTVNAPLTGPFGNQTSLTSADNIQLAGPNNTLNATFDGGDIVTGLTIKGVQTWNIQQTGLGGGIVALEGTAGTIDGLTTLNYTGNGLTPSEFLLGITGGGIDLTTPASGFNLGVSNAPGGTVEVVFAPAAFTGGDSINVTANAVGNALGGTSHTFGSATTIAAGSGVANGNGFATWNVNSTGANALNDIALNATGSKKATTLNISDDGSATWVWSGGDAADWANLTTINAALTTGSLTVTGKENGGNGLLADDASALTSVTAGAGADTFDLSAFGGAAGSSVGGLSINGGANTTIELSNTEINFVSAAGAAPFQVWNSVAVLDDVGVSAASDVGGAVNMAEFRGTDVVTLLSDTSGTTGILQTADFHVTNAPNNFEFNFNNTNQGGKNFEVDAVAGVAAAAGGTVTVNYGNGTNAFAADSIGNFTSIGFDNVNVNVSEISDLSFYGAGIIAEASLTGAEVLTITSSVNLDIADAATPTPGVSTISLLGGTLLNPTSGELVVNSGNGSVEAIGVTNANVIMSNTTLQMLGPDSDIAVTGALGAQPYTGVHVNANGTTDELQGSMGTVTTVANPDTGEGPGATTHTGHVGNDVLTDLHGGNAFLNWFAGEGGTDIINVANGNNEIFYGEYDINHAWHALAITNTSDHAFQGFWNVGNSAGEGGVIGAGSSTSADMSVINGFTMQGGSHDILDFNADAWGGGGNGGSAGTGQLENGLGLEVNGGAAGDAVMQLVGPGTQVNGATTFVLYTVGGLTNAADLASALSGVGAIQFGAAGHGGYDNGAHMLFAYASGGDIHIADVDFVNGLSAGFSTAGRTIVASDIYDIAGGNNGVTSSLAILGVNQHDVHFSFAA